MVHQSHFHQQIILKPNLTCILNLVKTLFLVQLFFSCVSAGQQVINDYTHKIVIKEDGTQSLIIVPAMPDDSGEWAVIAQNRAGKASVSMTLTVEGTYCAFYF